MNLPDLHSVPRIRARRANWAVVAQDRTAVVAQARMVATAPARMPAAIQDHTGTAGTAPDLMVEATAMAAVVTVPVADIAVAVHRDRPRVDPVKCLPAGMNSPAGG